MNLRCRGHTSDLWCRGWWNSRRSATRLQLSDFATSLIQQRRRSDGPSGSCCSMVHTHRHPQNRKYTIYHKAVHSVIWLLYWVQMVPHFIWVLLPVSWYLMVHLAPAATRWCSVYHVPDSRPHPLVLEFPEERQHSRGAQGRVEIPHRHHPNTGTSWDFPPSPSVMRTGSHARQPTTAVSVIFTPINTF